MNFGPPANFEIVVTGTESLVFEWDPPYGSEDLGILSYTLFCHPHFQDEISVTVPTTGTITLEDEFLPGTTYTCAVYGTNADGDGLRAVQTTITQEGIQLLQYNSSTDYFMLPQVKDIFPSWCLETLLMWRGSIYNRRMMVLLNPSSLLEDCPLGPLFTPELM